MLKILIKLPILKRLTVSFYKRYIFLFKKYKKTILVDETYFDLDLRHLIDRRFFFHKTYEEELFLPLCSIIDKYKINYFFDIGSCWGIYSLRLAKKFNQLKILAFDPINSNVKRLKDSIIKNRISNIQISRVALGDKKGVVNLGATEIYSPNYEINEKKAVITEICNVDTLDNLNNFKNKLIAVKIDVEGYELNILKGASKFLLNNNVFCQIEIKDKNFEEVVFFFKKYKFNLISINKFNKTDYFFSNFIDEKIII